MTVQVQDFKPSSKNMQQTNMFVVLCCSKWFTKRCRQVQNIAGAVQAVDKLNCKTMTTEKTVATESNESTSAHCMQVTSTSHKWKQLTSTPKQWNKLYKNWHQKKRRIQNSFNWQKLQTYEQLLLWTASANEPALPTVSYTASASFCSFLDGFCTEKRLHQNKNANKSNTFFSVRRLLASARSFNTFDCMLQQEWID